MVRRRLVLVGVIAVAALAGASAAAGSSPASHRQVVACPLRAGVVTPCCGPPVAQANTSSVCCAEEPDCCPVEPTPAATVPSCCTDQAPGSVCCPSDAGCAALPITIAVTPDPVAAGAAVTIAGTVSDGDGVTATLYAKPAGATSFSQVSTTTTGSSGSYTFTRPSGSVTSDTDFYVTSGTVQSLTVDEQVTARVTVATPPAGAIVGRPVTITGTVSPAQPGAQVLLLQRRGRDWNVVGRGRLSGTSAFAIKHRFRRAGHVHLEVELPANAHNAQSFSGTFAVAVATGG